ncbi:MAG: helix-turn-helix transcriptional regulator [Clostridia bacterium]|nr:helix-turn-helix transcriptional regulator [Clostridia bacterium]
MFFEKDAISFHILDVLKVQSKNYRCYNSERNYAALSFRYRADTVLKTETEEHRLGDNTITYVPAHLNYTRIAKLDDLICIHFETPDMHSREPEYFVTRHPEIFAPLFQAVFDCWNEKKPGYRYRCSAYLYKILAECFAENCPEAQSFSRIAPSVEYMNSHFSDPNLSIQLLAKKSFISEVYFRKLFQKEYGTSPKRHLIQLRIQYAAALIASGYYSLKEISAIAGYQDYKYFSVEFKRLLGVSPSEYSYNFLQEPSEENTLRSSKKRTKHKK